MNADIIFLFYLNVFFELIKNFLITIFNIIMNNYNYILQNEENIGKILFQNYDICKHAVKNNYKALKYINSDFGDIKIYDYAIINNKKAIKFIPKELKHLFEKDYCYLYDTKDIFHYVAIYGYKRLKNKNSDREFCSICFQKKKFYFGLNGCNHIYCKKCFNIWYFFHFEYECIGCLKKYNSDDIYCTGRLTDNDVEYGKYD